MDRITFRITEELKEGIDQKVARGEFPNRSEAIRAAIRNMDDIRESKQLRADGGVQAADEASSDQLWAAGPRDLEAKLEAYYGVEGLWLEPDYYDEERDEVLYEVLVYNDSDGEMHLLAEDLPRYGHGPSGAAGVDRDALPLTELVQDVVDAAEDGGSA